MLQKIPITPLISLFHLLHPGSRLILIARRRCYSKILIWRKGPMLQKISNNWWLFILRGLIAITFGIVAIVKPEQTIHALVLVFGAFTLVDGIFAIVFSLSSAAYFDKWWLLLLQGAAGIIVGCLAIFMPTITSLALLYLIAAWALVTGIFEIAVAIEFRRVISGEWMLILGGLL